MIGKIRSGDKIKFDGPVKTPSAVMPVPEQARDDGSGIHKPLKSHDSGSNPA